MASPATDPAAAPTAPGQPGPARSRLGRLVPPLAAAGALGLASLALNLRDPHVQGSWGFCPFHALTGLWCPGCGSLRAVNDLTHGDVLGAASSNLVLVLALPFVAVIWAAWLRRSWAGTRRRVTGVPPAVVWLVVVPVVVFWVVRNLPFGAWLAP